MHALNHLTAKKTWPPLAHSLRRDADLSEAANSRSGEIGNRVLSRILAQARRSTWPLHEFSLKRDGQRGIFHDFSLRRDLLAWARHGVAQNVDRSPRRALVVVSTLILSPRRDKLAWAKIAASTTVNPHAAAETAQIHPHTHMQTHIIR